MLHEIKHRSTGAVLFSLECGSLRLCVEAAVKARADLVDADLGGANLGGADLVGADLVDADLVGADLGSAWIIDGGQDKRSFRFMAGQHKDGHIQYRAGCKTWQSIDEARDYYGLGYDGNGDVAECLARLELMHSIAMRLWTGKQS